MKIRDSGMPEESLWETFFNSREILTKLEFTGREGDVVEFGCGYGTFTIPAARMTSHTVYALDVEPEMIEATRQKIEESALANIRLIERDFAAQGTGLGSETAGYVMLFNILHCEDPLGLLREAHRLLAPAGKVGVIHWNYDPLTPRGPEMSIRPQPQQCRQWLRQSGFQLVIPFVDLPPYHYGLVGQKTVSNDRGANQWEQMK